MAGHRGRPLFRGGRRLGTYGSLRRANRSGLTDITTIIGAIGGAAVTKLFPAETAPSAPIALGLAIGFLRTLRRRT